jgi:hypothetical protein
MIWSWTLPVDLSRFLGANVESASVREYESVIVLYGTSAVAMAELVPATE